jgi:uncharacterized protein (DUF2252 family)
MDAGTGQMLPGPAAPPEHRRRAGRALRAALPRGAHAAWHPSADRSDPVQTLIDQGATRIAALLPVRYARMRADPFAFLRGAAAIMAADLGTLPRTPIRVQCSGDAHLANFGSYASPDGIPVFDLNDFDETLPAPFEWDLKRLATSLVVAARVAGSSDRAARRLAVCAARSYRLRIGELAVMPPVLAWNQPVDLRRAIGDIDDDKVRRAVKARLAAVLESSAEHYGLIEQSAAGPRLREKPNLVWHIDAHELPARAAFDSYATALQEDRRVLLARYSLADVAMKVVGVGSVGTLCAVGLWTAGDGTPLLLQIKQAQDSVLAQHAGPSGYTNQGERVVVGQRMMQATSDVFLGWTCQELDGRMYYVRRLKDARLAQLGALLEQALAFYAALCGQTLARAHARAGDAALIAGYAGSGDALDEAIGDFAMAYADQTERDWHALQHAIAIGRITASEPPA